MCELIHQLCHLTRVVVRGELEDDQPVAPACRKPGERRGGRKRGTPNKASAARQAEVAASGITPLEVMLDNMRVAHQRAGTAKYVHPKLANISHANEPDHPLIVSDEERANAVLALLTQGGADLTT
jgi:hypothetical protein